MKQELLNARNNLREKLLHNAEIVVKEILEANLNGLKEIGLFGSLAKDKFNCKSDSDIYLIFKDFIPDRQVKGNLRTIAEENNCDIVFMTMDEFAKKGLLAENILESRMILWMEDIDD